MAKTEPKFGGGYRFYKKKIRVFQLTETKYYTHVMPNSVVFVAALSFFFAPPRVRIQATIYQYFARGLLSKKGLKLVKKYILI